MKKNIGTYLFLGYIIACWTIGGVSLLLQGHSAGIIVAVAVVALCGYCIVQVKKDSNARHEG